jgi:hypothetical protein
MENLKIEEQFILTGVFNLSEFFRINQEMNTEKVEFDMIKPSYNEWHMAEYKKEIKAFDEAWIKSVLK